MIVADAEAKSWENPSKYVTNTSLKFLLEMAEFVCSQQKDSDLLKHRIRPPESIWEASIIFLFPTTIPMSTLGVFGNWKI